MVSQNQTTVTLPNGGSLRGSIMAEGVRAFLGIPYATVTKRWRPAQRIKPWSGERDATKNGPKCPQPKPTLVIGPFIPSDVEANEYDCLNLNVYIPKSASETLLPVMVWVHGGSFRDGTAAADMYNPEYMVSYAELIQHPVIVVTINYRINVFGFFCSDDIAADVRADPKLSGNEKSVGNWGLMDQKLAFEWVKENIQAFGGNPNSITAFGESAGAISLAYHMTIPSHKGLFHRAILESGTIQTSPALPISAQGKAFDNLLANFNIPTNLPGSEKVERLRAIPADKFADAIVQLKPDFFPHTDGILIVDDVRKTANNVDAWDAGVKEVLLGDCKDEGTIFAARLGWNTVTWFNGFAAKIATIPILSDSQKSAFQKLYPTPSTDLEAFTRASEIIGDGLFGLPIKSTADILYSGGKRKVYYYHFDHDLHATIKLGGVHHAVDLAFVFLRRPYLNADEVKVAEKVVEFWVRFAYEEDSTNFKWPEYGKDRNALVFAQDGRVLVENVLRKEEKYKFWDDMYKAGFRPEQLLVENKK